MQFALYLVDQRLVAAEQFVEAVRRHQDICIPLGQLAIECGKLSVRQVYEVLRLQAVSEHDRFGEAAIELGMLSLGEVAELLLMQADRRPDMGAILVDMDVLTHDQLDECLAAFRRQAERHSTSAAGRRADCETATPELAAV